MKTHNEYARQSREKIELRQEKSLVFKLYQLTYSGSAQMNAEECSQLADMIIRLRGKGCTCDNDKT